MEDSNGFLKFSKAMNGIKGPAPSRQSTVSRRAKNPGFFARAARLLTWYSILTILFRCPATPDACDAASPYLCRPYLGARDAVAPHLEPYYHAYAAPYVDLARPYYDSLDRAVIAPSWSFATAHAAPRVAQAKAHATDLWDESVQPRLSSYDDAARSRYRETLGPHVDRLSAALGPYYDAARTNALQTYYEILVPSFEFVQPYAHHGYRLTSSFVADTAFPSARWAWHKTYVFLDATVWPHLRLAYVESVEPQLVKIGQRLGRHNGKNNNSSSQRPPAPITSAASSFVKPAPSVSYSSSVTPTTSAASTEVPSTEPPQSSGAAPPAETATDLVRGGRGRLISIVDRIEAPELRPGEADNEKRRIAHETVAADLRDWQDRYAKAAEEGAVEIEQRVEEISTRLADENARTRGKALLDEFQATVASELAALKTDILAVITSEEEAAGDEITAAVRRAGVAIKTKAQEVRAWREAYERELQSAISTAAQDHFAILDGIHDLAMQKIGMKWAWMDGITYRDWAKFHQLKGRFAQWHADLEKLVVTHPDLEAAQLAAADVEDRAMDAAQSAAAELARLKQVGLWKLAAADASDEFASEPARLAAAAVESRKREEQADEPADEPAESTTESIFVEPSAEPLADSPTEPFAEPSGESSVEPSAAPESSATPQSSIAPETSVDEDEANEEHAPDDPNTTTADVSSETVPPEDSPEATPSEASPSDTELPTPEAPEPTATDSLKESYVETAVSEATEPAQEASHSESTSVASSVPQDTADASSAQDEPEATESSDADEPDAAEAEPPAPTFPEPDDAVETPDPLEDEATVATEATTTSATTAQSAGSQETI